MTFQFAPGRPKAACEITLPRLKKEATKVTAVKSVGSGQIKLFAVGDYNFYIDDSPELRSYLAHTFGLGV